MIIEEIVSEARIVWRRSGKKITRGIRCTSGKRKGRVVSNASQCSKPINMKKRLTLKKIKARMGSRMARKAKKTRRLNPISRKVQSLNKKR